MPAPKLTLVVIAGAVCIAAAAAGGFLAGRSAPIPPPTPDSAPLAHEAASERQEAGAPASTPAPAPTAAAPASVPSSAAPSPSVPQASSGRAASRGSNTAPVTAPTPRAEPARTETVPDLVPTTAAATPAAAASTAPPVAPVPAAAAAAPTAAASPAFEELVVSTGTVIGLRNDTPLSSESAEVEDRVDARVTRDVRVNGRVVIPSGTRAIGAVTAVVRGGKVRGDAASLSLRFHTLVLGDGTRLRIATDAISRVGEAPSETASRRIGGGAVAGALLGALTGGRKGALAGAATGAATGAVVAPRSEAELPAGAELSVRVQSPVAVLVTP